MRIDPSNPHPRRMPREATHPDRDYEFVRLDADPPKVPTILNTLDPYAPDNRTQNLSTHEAPEFISPEQNVRPLFYVAKSTFIWTLVCSISAIPSWILASASSHLAYQYAMAAGVATFIVFYVLLDYFTRHAKVRRIPEVRTALRITYIIRLVLSVTMVGTIIDLPCGIASRMLIGLLGIAPDRPFERMAQTPNPSPEHILAEIYAWTLAQGLVLNIVLFFLFIVILAFIQFMNRLAVRNN